MQTNPKAFTSTPSSPKVFVGDIGRFFIPRTTTLRGDERGVKGFTLIELLVVVLIIGILSAVALPQYQKAVVKTRAITILPVLKSIKDAEEVYYLTNGEYTEDAEKLDVVLPALCALTDGASGSWSGWKCGKDFFVDIELDSVLASYCPEKNDSYETCAPNRIFQLGYYYANPKVVGHVPPNILACWRPSSSPVTWGTDLCKTLGTPLTGTGVHCGSCYQIQ